MSSETPENDLITHRVEAIPFDERQLPGLLQGQISKLNELDASVTKAIKAAESAKSAADSAAQKSAGMFQKKAAIEELQKASLDLAGAVIQGADAQRLSFEFQQKLAEISKFLFGLGVSNIAANRMVVRELELKLNGASKQQLSDLARQELIGVVKQLKDQEDIMVRQERTAATLRTQGQRLDDWEATFQGRIQHVDQEVSGLHDALVDQEARQAERDRTQSELREALAHDLQSRIGAEAKAREATSQALNQRIDQGVSGLHDALAGQEARQAERDKAQSELREALANDLHSRIEAETKGREATSQALNQRLDQEVSGLHDALAGQEARQAERDTAQSKLREALAHEIQSRIEAETKMRETTFQARNQLVDQAISGLHDAMAKQEARLESLLKQNLRDQRRTLVLQIIITVLVASGLLLLVRRASAGF